MSDKQVVKDDKPVYAFPSKSRCPNPHCLSVRTERTGQKGRLQYRRCMTCNHTYNEVGKLI